MVLCFLVALPGHSSRGRLESGRGLEDPRLSESWFYIQKKRVSENRGQSSRNVVGSLIGREPVKAEGTGC